MVHWHLPMVDTVSLLTEAQLKVAAKFYCTAFGLDPDERLVCAHPDGYAVAIYRTRLEVVMDLIRDHDVKAEAVHEARDEQA